MYKIAVHVNKGGVGKTTIAGLLAYEISKKEKDVVILDFDLSQGNMTHWLSKEEIQYEIGDYFKNRHSLAGVIIEVRPHLFLLPCRSIQSETKKWSRNEGRRPEGEEQINRLFEELTNMGFDYLIADLAPGLEDTQELILTYVDEVINVFKPDAFGIEGLVGWREEIQDVHRARKLRRLNNFKNDIVILNDINEGFSLHKNVRKQFKDHNITILELNTDQKIPNVIPINLFPQEIKETKESTLKQLQTIGDYICL